MIVKRAFIAAFAAVFLLNTAQQTTAQNLATWAAASPKQRCYATDDPHFVPFSAPGWVEYQRACPFLVADNCPATPAETTFSIVINTFRGFPSLINGAFITLKSSTDPLRSRSTTIQFTDNRIYIDGTLFTMPPGQNNRVFTRDDTRNGCACNFRISTHSNFWLYAIDHKFEFMYRRGFYDLYMEEDTWRGDRKVCGLCGDIPGTPRTPFRTVWSNPTNGAIASRSYVRAVAPVVNGSTRFTYTQVALPSGHVNNAVVNQVQNSWLQTVPWRDFTPSTCSGAFDTSSAPADCWSSLTNAQRSLIDSVCIKMKQGKYKYCGTVVNIDRMIESCRIDLCMCKDHATFNSLPTRDPMDPNICPFVNQAFIALEQNCAVSEFECTASPTDKKICRASADDLDDSTVTCPPQAFVSITSARANTTNAPTDPLCGGTSLPTNRDITFAIRRQCQGKNACRLDLNQLLRPSENLVHVSYTCLCQDATGGGGSNCPANSAITLVQEDDDLTDNDGADARMACVCHDGYRATYDESGTLASCVPAQCPVPDPTTAGYMRFENCNGQQVGNSDCIVSCARPYVLAPSPAVRTIPEGSAQINVLCAAAPGEVARFNLPACEAVVNRNVDRNTNEKTMATLNSFVAPALDLSGRWREINYRTNGNRTITLSRHDTTPSMYALSPDGASFLLNPDGGLYPCDDRIDLGVAAATCYYDSKATPAHARIIAGSRATQSVVVWCTDADCLNGSKGPEKVWSFLG